MPYGNRRSITFSFRWLVHNDDGVWPWYDSEKPGIEQARQRAAFMGESWNLHGVHKWIAYDLPVSAAWRHERGAVMTAVASHPRSGTYGMIPFRYAST